MKNYKDKVVVITGSANGIGFSLAKQFGREGAKVVISDLSGDEVENAVAQLTSMGFAVAGKTCDVTDREQVEALADFSWATFGKADVIVNNAGITQTQRRVPLIDMGLDDFRRVHEVNFYGVLHGIQVFGKRFIEQGTDAAIYNLGSENSVYPCVPMSHAYISSKHAVLPVTELLAEEVPDFIDVALIMPGFVNSNMTKGPFDGMDTDEYTALVLKQLKAGEFYIVSHSYNKVRIDQRYELLAAAYEKYAPRYDGDEKYDVRSLVAKMLDGQT